jgi:heme-degrading monooxygenase HmoA
MVMRLVQVRFRLEKLLEYQQVYEQRIMPELEKVPGCLYAGVLQNDHHTDEGCSLTLWESREHLEAYVGSGKFETLLELSRPFLAESGEWKLRLAENAQLEYGPVPLDPVIQSYQEATAAVAQPPAGRQSSSLFMRMVTIPVQPDKEAEFKRIYEQEVHPQLLETRGCRYVFMVENMDRAAEWVCVTIWDRKEDADRYEEEGGFRKTRERFGPTLSGLFQWKIGVDKQIGRQAVTSEDMAVTTYRVVTGKSFE